MITYIISSGYPCAVDHPEQARTIHDAVADFRDYINMRKRYGNEYHNAHLYILETNTTYTVGPRGGNLIGVTPW